MATLLRMPEVAANATHATLQAWTRQEGDRVSAGDVLAEIETDKAVVEISADSAGVMGCQWVKAGQEIAVGAPIGGLLAPGETQADLDRLAGVEKVAVAEAAAAPSAPRGAPAPRHASSGSNAAATRLFASPLAKRLAAASGIDLAGLRGTGPNGRIVKADVLSATAAAGAGSAEAPAAPCASSGFTETPHTGMRRAIAQRLSESKATIPHFYLRSECRTERLLALRAELNAGRAEKFSVNDFVVRAAALALAQVPQANVGWTEHALRQYADADIAVAVSTDGGLITPIVRAAQRKPLAALSAEIAELAARARASRLRPQEYQGGTFCVSNLGMHGVSEFSAIINPPQAAILAVGAIESVPVADDGTVSIAPVMRCTLSVDHRALDGAVAARWLQAFRQLIENPLGLLV